MLTSHSAPFVHFQQQTSSNLSLSSGHLDDVAVGHPDPGDPNPCGATFLAVAWPRSGGEVRFRVVSSTAADDAAPRGGYSIEDLWFEWPAVSVVRAGTVYPPPRRGVRP
ncbi:MAG TPA: hypothetical protein VF486_09300 [Actinomycetes bacterium]